jgi:TolB-like protein/Flp pilus assembly protein TadD
MMAAIVVPARSRSIATTCAFLVPARVLGGAPEDAPTGTDRLDDLRLVGFGRARVMAFGLDLVLLMGASGGLRDAIRRTASAPPRQVARRGSAQKRASAASSQHSNARFAEECQSILSNMIALCLPARSATERKARFDGYIGGNPEQEYFVDGVTESLTTDLSRIRGAFVIARNTAFTFKGKAVDVKKLGRELNIRYVLEGSVQRGGNRLRVNVQLIDAETGNHLWAERFDKPTADLFDMQDEIVSRLANTLNAELIAAEARRAERSPHPDAMDLYFQGWAYLNRGPSPENSAQARSCFQRALLLEPNNIEALIGGAMVDLQLGNIYLADRAERLAAAERAALAVLSLAPNHAMAHMLLGVVQALTNRGALGIAQCERALELDRNLADAHAYIGLAKYVIGRGDETEAHIRDAIRLSPRDAFASRWMMHVGYAKLQIGADADAVLWFRRGIEANRNYAITYFGLAAALAQLGALHEARLAAQEGLALDPSFTIRRWRDSASTDDPTYLAGRERICEGIRLAGVPES